MNALFSKLVWDWKVKQISENEFLIMFPLDEYRSQLTKFVSFDFRDMTTKASVIPSNMTEDVVDELIEVWVKIFGIPAKAKNEMVIKALVELVGEYVELDEASIKGEMPVRAKIACKDPHQIHFTLHVYINKVGYKIRWEAEGHPKKDPPPPPQGDDDDLDDGGDKDDYHDKDGDKEDKNEEDYLDSQGSHDEAFRNLANSLKVPLGSKSAPPAWKKGQSGTEGTKMKSYLVDNTNDEEIDSWNLMETEKVEQTQLVLWSVQDKRENAQESQEDDLPLSAPVQNLAELMDTDLEKLDKGFDLEYEDEQCDIPTMSDIERWREEEEQEEAEPFKEVSKKKTGKGKKSVVEPVVTSWWNLRQKDNVPIPRKAKILTQKKNLELLAMEGSGETDGGAKVGVFDLIAA